MGCAHIAKRLHCTIHQINDPNQLLTAIRKPDEALIFPKLKQVLNMAQQDKGVGKRRQNPVICHFMSCHITYKQTVTSIITICVET